MVIYVGDKIGPSSFSGVMGGIEAKRVAVILLNSLMKAEPGTDVDSQLDWTTSWHCCNSRQNVFYFSSSLLCHLFSSSIAQQSYLPQKNVTLFVPAVLFWCRSQTNSALLKLR